MGTVTAMKKTTTKSNTKDIHARCFVCLYTIDATRAKLTKQRADQLAIFKEQLSTATKSYREPLRVEENRTASKNKQAKLFIECMDGVAERDRINEEKKATLEPIDKTIKQLNEAEAEAMSAHRGDDVQAKLFDDEVAGAVKHMPWATPGTRKIMYSSLLALEGLKVKLDDHQRELLGDLGDAQTGTIDLGLSASEAIEQDVNDDDFEDDEAEDPETDPDF